MTKRNLHISRRVLLGSGLSAALLSSSGVASARTVSGNKMVIIILRGAMDGLGAVPVIGRDAGGEALSRFRPDLIDKNAVPFSEGFFLHPSLSNVSRLVRKGQDALCMQPQGLTANARTFWRKTFSKAAQINL